MKPNKEAHAALRAVFNQQMASTHFNRQTARAKIRQARLIRAQAPDTTRLMESYQLTTEGYRLLRDSRGSRELCLALAFCNNTPYAAAEKPVHTCAPNSVRLIHLLMTCFPMDDFDPRVEMNRTWRGILTAWFAGQKPRDIIQALVARYSPETTPQTP